MPRRASEKCQCLLRRMVLGRTVSISSSYNRVVHPSCGLIRTEVRKKIPTKRAQVVPRFVPRRWCQGEHQEGAGNMYCPYDAIPTPRCLTGGPPTMRRASAAAASAHRVNGDSPLLSRCSWWW